MSARLPSIQYKRIAGLFEQAERIWTSRPDVQKAYPDICHWEFWYWLMWHGSREYSEIAELIYPDPPSHLMHRVVGQEATSRSFLESGLVDWRRLYLSLVEGGFNFDAGGRVLDFGCGCGRILRLFSRYAATCDLYGGDVDAEAVNYCASTLDFARFSVLGKLPPTSFPRESFDAVYAFSVFSHLPERVHRLWLEDLFRIMRPAGILVLTVQGRRVIEKMIARQLGGLSRLRFPLPLFRRVIERMIARFLDYDIPSSKDLQRDLPEIERTGFAFYPYRQLKFDDFRNQQHFDEWDLETYGSCFIMESYIRKQWTDLFQVVSWHAAPDDWQDYVILARLQERRS